MSVRSPCREGNTCKEMHAVTLIASLWSGYGRFPAAKSISKGWANVSKSLPSVSAMRHFTAYGPTILFQLWCDTEYCTVWTNGYEPINTSTTSECVSTTSSTTSAKPIRSTVAANATEAARNSSSLCTATQEIGPKTLRGHWMCSTGHSAATWYRRLLPLPLCQWTGKEHHERKYHH